MQSDSSFFVRAKAQSVFRACIEQMEMYKDTGAYQATVRTFIESAMGLWMTSLKDNLASNVKMLSDEDFNAAIKLNYSTFKVCLVFTLLRIDYCIIGESISIHVTTKSRLVSRYCPLKPRSRLSTILRISLFSNSILAIKPLCNQSLRDPSNCPTITLSHDRTKEFPSEIIRPAYSSSNSQIRSTFRWTSNSVARRPNFHCRWIRWINCSKCSTNGNIQFCNGSTSPFLSSFLPDI